MTRSAGKSRWLTGHVALGALLGVVILHPATSAAGRSGPAFVERERGRPLASVIDAGEGEQAEFKASARWDFKQGKMNLDLENAVARTIAGFLNHRGGTLLVGVGDSGAIVGLEHDYRTLRRRDGTASSSSS